MLNVADSRLIPSGGAACVCVCLRRLMTHFFFFFLNKMGGETRPDGGTDSKLCLAKASTRWLR